MQRELQELREEQDSKHQSSHKPACNMTARALGPSKDWLLRVLRGNSTESLDELDLKVRGSYGPLAEDTTGRHSLSLAALRDRT